MSHDEGGAEKRRFQRFPVRDLAFAVLEPYFGRLGQLKDVSRGGVGFEYVEFEEAGPERPTGPLRLEVMRLAEGFCLQDFPCRIVYDEKSPNASALVHSVITRRCGVAFGSLSAEQETDLDQFITSHALSG
ncbi:MAG: PilZ domain-containing protein [Thermodesulfobacteriota bacterium]